MCVVLCCMHTQTLRCVSNRVFAPKVERLGKEMESCFCIDARNGRQTGTLFNKTGYDKRRRGEEREPDHLLEA